MVCRVRIFGAPFGVLKSRLETGVAGSLSLEGNAMESVLESLKETLARVRLT